MSIEWHGIDRMRSGPLFEIAGRASLRVRRRAYEWLAEKVGGFAGKVVLDHGATPDTISADSNCHIPWLLADGATVYATSAEDISHLPSVFPGLHVVAWPPQEHFGRQADVVISSSVIAHVGDRATQLNFVADLMKLGKTIFLTTPNRRHWLEFHTKLPLLHWLSNDRYYAVLSAIGLGFWTHLNLLTHDDLQTLFEQAAARNGTPIETQWYEPRFLGMVSNLVILATPSAQTDANARTARMLDEGRTLGRYALGRDVDEMTRALYARASLRLNDDAGDAVVRFATTHPWSIGPLDGALALTQPDAPLHKKLLLMTAILETRPGYCADFLPRDRPFGYAFSVAYAIARAAVFAAAGLVIARIVR